MAGHALGLNLKPHPQLDLDADLERALDYVKAKQLSAEWTDMCRIALNKFRRFQRQERGLPPSPPSPPDLSRQQEGLPDWLVEQLTRYQHLMQRNWRPARLGEQIRRFWSGHSRLWRWLVEERGIVRLADLRRAHVMDYVDHRLAAGYAVSGINNDLRVFHAFLHFLQDQEFEACPERNRRVPQALFRIRSLKPPDSLQVPDRRASPPSARRDRSRGEPRHHARAATRCPYGASRFLPLRGLGPTDHVFLYRNEPLCKDLVRSRLKAAGERVGVKVYLHHLRHTTATQLLNASCRVTSIQKFPAARGQPQPPDDY